VNSPEAVVDPQLRHRGHFVLSRTPATMWRAGPTYGEDTSEILADVLGYDVDRIAEIAISGVLE
jgi:crotonobetainyl-CoA:carnitine CoA-transferase CaiB-like acyl-CoA transferase